MTVRPCHVFDDRNAKTTRCGIPKKDDACLPYVLAEFVEAHRVTFCSDCSAQEALRGLEDDTLDALTLWADA